MAGEKIEVQRLNRVGILTLNHPPANALDSEMKDELRAKFTQLSQEDPIWTLILTGAGEKMFAAGANIPELLSLDRESGRKRVLGSRELFGLIAGCAKPVIAAINGFCLGGGLELALCCDIRIAADHVKLGVPEVGLGFIPGAGGTQRLPRVVGPGWANYLLLTGEAISAPRALEIGLVQEVVPYNALRETALKIADKINRKGPLAVRAAKRVSRKGLQHPLEEGLDMENQAFADLCETQDKNEGVNAFLEKRKPAFQAK